jgi:hypothetical protein
MTTAQRERECNECGDPPEPKMVRCLKCGDLFRVNGPHQCGQVEPPYNKEVPKPERAGQQLVDKDRWADYGDPRIAWDRIAKAWSVILGSHVTPRQAVLCMLSMKVIRESIGHKPDNVADIEGYTEILKRLPNL